MLLLLLVSMGCNQKPTADLILFNGKIYTVDSSFSTVQAMVVTNGRIVETGANALADKYQFRQKIDLMGKSVYPGFIDAHCHFYGYSTDLPKCALFDTKSFDEVVQRVKEYAANNKFSWILGRGWDQNDWQDSTYPDKTLLDSLFPNTPVYLMRIDGHAVLVNQKALDIAGITTSTKVQGGEIITKNKHLTGLLIDNAVDIVKAHIPEFTAQIKKEGLIKGEQNCFAVGLTSLVDAGLRVEDILLLDSLQKAGTIKMKIYAMAELSNASKNYWFKRGKYKTDYLQVKSFKLYADGALGSRGACLLLPYSDMPGHFGFMLKDEDSIQLLAKEIYDSGFQLNTHCIGDSANRFMLQVYAANLKTKNDLRWRIEHCQVVNHADLKYFSDYSIIPSVQPTHATSDMYWAEKRLGSERIHDAYSNKALLKETGMLALGSDFPVEDINPLFGFYAAVVRKDQKGFPPAGFESENKISRIEALRGMTIWAAYSMFEEKEKGSLEKGKVADFVILNDDLMTAPDSILYKLHVQATYSNGVKVYENKK